MNPPKFLCFKLLSAPVKCPDDIAGLLLDCTENGVDPEDLLDLFGVVEDMSGAEVSLASPQEVPDDLVEKTETAIGELVETFSGVMTILRETLGDVLYNKLGVPDKDDPGFVQHPIVQVICASGRSFFQVTAALWVDKLKTGAHLYPNANFLTGVFPNLPLEVTAHPKFSEALKRVFQAMGPDKGNPLVTSIDRVKNLVKHFWAGYKPTVMSRIPYFSALFGADALARHMMSGGDPTYQFTLQEELLACTAATAASTGPIVIAEGAKLLKQGGAEGGLLSTFSPKALAQTFGREFVFSACVLVLIPKFSEFLAEKWHGNPVDGDGNPIPIPESLKAKAAAASTFVIATLLGVVTNPFDFQKTREQLAKVKLPKHELTQYKPSQARFSDWVKSRVGGTNPSRSWFQCFKDLAHKAMGTASKWVSQTQPAILSQPALAVKGPFQFSEMPQRTFRVDRRSSKLTSVFPRSFGGYSQTTKPPLNLNSVAKPKPLPKQSFGQTCVSEVSRFFGPGAAKRGGYVLASLFALMVSAPHVESAVKGALPSKSDVTPNSK